MAKTDMPALAAKIVERLGGKENLAQINHCATRLRVTVKKPEKVDVDALKKVRGVLGVELAGENCQVIVGQIIEDLFVEVEGIVGALGGSSAPGKSEGPKSPAQVFKDFLLMVAGILSPCIPALTVAGFLSMILTIMTLAFGIDSSNSTYSILYNFAQSAFYFLPVFVAYTSAKRFGTEPVLAMLLAGGLLYPGWRDMVAAGSDTGFVSYFGLPVFLTNYNGAVVQIILGVWIMSKLDGLLKRIIPEVVRHFLKPFVLLLIMSVVMLTVAGPLGALITNYVTAGANWLNEVAPWATVGLLVTFALTIGVACPGFHLALVAIATTNIDTIGYDNLINIYFFCCTITAGWIALAVAIKTKNSNLRQIAWPAAVSALFGGVSEPTKYGIMFKMVRPYWAYMITSISAAFIAGFMQLKCFAYGGYSLTNIMLYLGVDLDYGNFYNALILVAYMAVVAFISTWLLGFDDSVYNDEGDERQQEGFKGEPVASEDLALQPPCAGQVIAQADITDPVFSQGILGPCFGVKPSEETIVSPVAGTVYAVADTKHAITFTTEDGAEVLVHIGIDSVSLGGEGIEVSVARGQRVEVGQAIARYEKSVFASKGIDETVVTALLNGRIYKEVRFQEGGAALFAIAGR